MNPELAIVLVTTGSGQEAERIASALLPLIGGSGPYLRWLEEQARGERRAAGDAACRGE